MVESPFGIRYTDDGLMHWLQFFSYVEGLTLVELRDDDKNIDSLESLVVFRGYFAIDLRRCRDDFFRVRFRLRFSRYDVTREDGSS